MGDVLTLEQLARYTGEPEERLRDWRERGIIGQPDGEAYSASDVEGVRLVQLLLRRGIGIDAIVEAVRSGMFDWVYAFPWRETGGPVYSLPEAAEMLGVSLATLQRFRDAMGSVGPDDFMSEDELGLMRGWKIAAQAGVPEEAMIGMVRVYTDNLDRIAEAEQRLYRFYVQQRLEAEGLSPQALIEQSQAAADQLNPLIEPIILYFHRRGLQRAVRENVVMTLAEQQGLVEKSESPGALQMAVMFIDLSSFTPLAEAMGDVAAAAVLERFSTIVRQSVGTWTGRVVKQIGDAFMLVFPEARSAVGCALEIESKAAKEAHFPALRAGIHWGTVLYREGDYVGSNVNIASRIANEAQRHQVLVTSEVRKEVRDLPEVELVRLGRRQLKGVSVKVELFEVRSSGAPAGEKAIDPVCGMELGAGEVAARLSLEGAERAFCSEVCLRKFVASPEAYNG
jgi:class 3 adenylate cyclase